MYSTRTFWSPDQKYLLTVHCHDEKIVGLLDDNGEVWPAAGPQESIQDDEDDRLPENTNEQSK